MLLKLGQLGFRSSASSVFTPTDIANLALWIDAADSSTITDMAGAVSQWDDKSGNNNNAIQGTASLQPTTGTATIGGKNAIDFDGSNYMDFTSAISRLNGYTVFSVIKTNDITSSAALVSGNVGSLRLAVDSSEQIDIVRQSQAVALSGSVPITIGSDTIISARTSGAGSNTQINGVAANSNTTNPAYSQDLYRIGVQKEASELFFFDGQMGDILIYDRILTDTEMNQVGNYLKLKWGISWTNI